MCITSFKILAETLPEKALTQTYNVPCNGGNERTRAPQAGQYMSIAQ